MNTSLSLSMLETNGLIRLFQREPELEYLFRHALVQDAAYDSLLKADRRNIHLLTGKIMETLYTERLDEVAPELARHFHEAGENTRAAEYYTRAGHRAFGTFANIEAVDYFHSAIELHPDKHSESFADLHISLGNVLYTLGRQIESVPAYLTAAQISHELDDINKCMRCYNMISRSYFFAGDFQMQYETASKGYELFKEHPNSVEAISTLRTMANACYFNGKAQEAIEYASQALELSRQSDDILLRGIVLVTYGTVLPHNESTKKLNAMREAADFARTHVFQSFSTAMFNYAETVVNINGDWRYACDLFREGTERVHQANALLAEFWQMSGLQKALTIAGQFEEADELNERLNELRDLIPDHGTVGGAFAVIDAIRAYYNGDCAQAISILENGLSDAIKHNDQQLINEMGVWLAEVGIDVDRYDLAAEILPKAIAAGDDNLIWGAVIPRCLLAAVQIHNGQIQSARQTIEEAKNYAQPDPGLMAQYALAVAQARLASAEKHWQDASAFYEQACALTKQMELNWQHQCISTEWNTIKGNLL